MCGLYNHIKYKMVSQEWCCTTLLLFSDFPEIQRKVKNMIICMSTWMFVCARQILLVLHNWKVFQVLLIRFVYCRVMLLVQ